MMILYSVILQANFDHLLNSWTIQRYKWFDKFEIKVTLAENIT